ncbi:MAG: hypothetical protein COY66_02285 [Candidatus Kerfeldbacteria bacterium CG_4_10_14_0_8_um_filter_42_10]|uniref:Fibronectin type-III domain-containing protein n=1 Tax=Candidatus Kerfeldbacteria bacterium CG_4_10_14_0_8_um_filter_42_10 TaxID=2014248 RepID=A0A2M7RKR7_9BACT|nr:MAG: hypothetical protein COY66_02285 [Candidatus Kerfeldbacteria bacterium CG_4_10_14_0_8_um_filter_42_10]
MSRFWNKDKRKSTCRSKRTMRHKENKKLLIRRIKKGNSKKRVNLSVFVKKLSRSFLVIPKTFKKIRFSEYLKSILKKLSLWSGKKGSKNLIRPRKAYAFLTLFRKRKFQLTSVILLIFLGFGYWVYYSVIVKAVSATYTLDSQSDWEAGEYYSGTIDTTTTADSIQISSGAGGTWSAETPGFITDEEGYGLWSYHPPYYGADLTTDGYYIYIIIGNRRPYLIRYNPELNTFKKLTDAPTAFLYGGSIAYYDDALYAIDGGEQNENGDAGKHFYKYDIALETWSRLADAPEDWGLGSDIVSNGTGLIYAARGRSTATFWSYNIATDTWDDTLPAIPGYQVYTTTGHALEYVDESYGDPTACAQGCVFAMRGNGNREFFRFDIAESQWYTATTIPVALGGPHYGGSMAYDPTDGYVYMLRGYNTDDFFKYDVDTETWDVNITDTPDAPGTVYGGGSLLRYGNYLYAIRGNGTPEFWRYDLTNEHWDSISTPLNVGNSYEGSMISFVPNGADCSDVDGCLFVAQGENTTTFWRYDINAHAWTTLNVIPGGMREGSSICYNGNGTIYALRGNNTLNFYSYSISGGTWSTLTSMPATHSGGTAGSLNARYGGGVTCMGATVYAQKGNNNNHFFSYNGVWAEEKVPPYSIYAGGAITNDGTYVYSLMGYWRSEFYRYQPGVGWTALASLPTSTYYADDIVYDGTNYIYTASGDYRDYFWRYSISDDTWERSIDFPERTSGYGTGITYDTGTDTLYALRGFNTTSIYKADMSTNQYADSVSWISDTLDLKWVESFTSFAASSTTPGATSIAYYSRTSTDQVNWSSWAAISGGTISSLARRYVQIKVTLTSDGTNTPTLSDFTITYEKDSDNPTNPTVTGYADSSKATTVTSGSSAYYTNPYFELSGATDESSGIAGYYVQWTTNGSADPSSSEDYYQTGTTYEVNTDLVSGTTYYLRIVTKDNAGNTSSAVSGFTYTYNGISPASTQTWTVQADFEAAGTTSSNVNTAAGTGTAMTLSSIAEGLWMDLPSTFGTAALTTAYNDTAMAFDGDDTIFVLRSVNSKSFFKYTISSKTWSSLADITSTANAYYGTTITYIPNGTQCADASGCVFALVGNNSTEFLRYNVGANTWTALQAYGGTGVGYGGSMVWNGGDYIFAFRSNNSTEFYRYSISGNSWVTRSSPSYAFNYGSSAVFVPNGTYCSDALGCIFALRGASTSQFLRYDVSANTWTNITAIPFYVQYGGALLYNNGTIYATRGYASDNFFSYDILNDRWDPLASLPSTHYFGSSAGMVYDTNTDIIYMLRGYNEYSFYSYDVRNNKWLNTGIPHDQTSNGFYYGGITYDGGDTIYYVRGNNTTDFYKYTISTGTHERLMDAPIPMYVGSDVVYVGGKVYAAGSYNKDNESKMYIYDVATNMWSNGNAAPAWLGYGANLVNGEDGAIYTVRGQNTTTNYKYTIATDTWSTVASTVPAAVYQGGCAVKASDGGTDYIYQIRAQNTADIFRFNIGTQTWDGATTLTDAPGNIYQSDACTYDGSDLIYVVAGTNANTNVYVYSISGDSWGTISTNDEYWYYGALETGTNGILYGFRGYNTSALTRFVPASSSTGFEQNGTWTSQILNLGSIYDFGGLTVNDTTQTNTSLKYEIRSCSDAGCSSDPDDANWADWDEVSNQFTYGSTDYYTVDSTPARYVQVRVTFSSDQIYTPTVNDITLSYYSDATAPTNPSSASGYTDNTKATSISNNTWTYDANPYFEWTATDNSGGIGVDGFYVYFGTNSSLDPIDNAADPTNKAYKSGTNFYTVSGGTTGSWNAATQSASALTSGTYYLIIRTKDINNNTALSSGVLYTFKLDIISPSNPTGVSVSPSGYSSTNSFAFSWTASSDTGGSSVAYYCYKTGAEGAEDTCIASSNTSVSSIQAYQSRGNTFYVRAKDGAGNYSSSYASTTYYYAGEAPTAPASVVVSPTSQTNNNTFSFSWSLPDTCLGQTPCEASDILRYCYTINELPNAVNCGTNTGGSTTPSPDGGWTTDTQTTNRLLSGFSAATQQGTNTLYIVATDLINNIDYSNYVTATYIFDSTAPGVPASIQATDSSDRSTSRYSITLTWDEPDDVGAGVDLYNIYRCEEDCQNPSTVNDPPDNYTKIASTSTLGYLDTGLDNTITYTYFTRAIGPGNAASGNSALVEMKPEGKFKSAPSMSGQPGVQTRIRSAVVEWLTLDDQDREGNIIPHPATSFVEYGETASYGNETGTSDMVSEHEVTLTDLTPETTYHFRCKWVDIDGNIGYSSDFTFTTNGAPSAPINLEVDPECNTVNRFKFTWGAPTDEGVTVAGYFYVVNNIPTEDNVSFTANTYIGPYDAATQQGINTFYVVAVDDSGNINYANYASVDFEAETEPPGPPQAVTITDSSDRDAKRYSITITWDPPEGYETSSSEDETEIVYYSLYRKVGEKDSFSEIARFTSTGFLDTGLDSSKEYFYKVVAEDKAGAASKATDIVSEVPEGRYTQPPAITVSPVATPDSFSADIVWETERIASSFVEFGLKANDLTEEQGTADLIAKHEIEVTGLKSETTYYYRIKSIDVDENIAYSEIDSFTTLEAPRVLEVKISDVKLYDAIISWETNKESTAVIQYGTTANYGLTYTDTSGSYALTHTVKLEGLTDSTTYHLRIGGEDRNGNPIASDDYIFATLTFPEVLTVSSRNQSEGQTEVTWTTNVPTTSEVEYYSENIPPKTQGNTAMVKEHVILLYGLEDATLYKFKVRGSDEFGYEAVSDENEFTTLEDTTPPVVSGIQSESNTIGAGEESKVQIIISWKTNEATTSQVEYGVGLGATEFTEQTDENAELVMDHLVVISDLAPAKTYRFRAVSRDKAGNTTKSGAYTVLTSRKRESFLQLIISNLEETFSWIGRIGGSF